MKRTLASLPGLMCAVGLLTCILAGQTSPDRHASKAAFQRLQQQAERFVQNRQSPDQQPAAAHLLKAWQNRSALRFARSSASPRASAANSNQTPQWQELGPKPLMLPYLYSQSGANSDYHAISGRVTAVAVDLKSDPTGNTVYVGTAQSGLWKSANGLASNPTFTPLTDSLPTQSIGSIAIDSSTQPATIYVGTGDQDMNQDSNFGMGILKSTDGGATWSLVSYADNGAHSFLGLSVDRILIDPSNPQHLVAATQSGALAANLPYPEAGIYASSDGGQTWSLQAQFTDYTGRPYGVTDLVYDASSKTYYAAVSGMGIYTSPDGATWTRTANPLVSGLPLDPYTFYRASLAVRNGTVFVLYCRSNGQLPTPYQNETGLVQSSDQGKTWMPIAVPPASENYQASPLFGYGSGYFDQYVLAPPNSSTLMIAGVQLWVASSVNGTGTTWTDPMANSKIDGYQHALAMVNGNVWYAGADGGVWSTQDGGTSWNNLNNSLGTIAVISILPSEETPGEFLATSLSGVAQSDHDGTSTWTGLGFSGDLLDLDPSNPSRIYLGGGTNYLVASNDDGKTFLASQFSMGGSDPAWNSPFEVIPSQPWELASATCRIWLGPGYSNPPGSGWQAVSPDLTTDQPGDQCPSQTVPGQPPNVSAIASAPSDANTLYAVTGNGRVEGTTNLLATNPSWTNLTAAPLPTDGSHTFKAVAVSPADSKTVYVGVSGFGVGHLFKSTDGGASWIDVSGNLPDAPLNSIVIDPENPSDVYVATDVGVFVTTDGGVSGEVWQQMGTGLPSVPVTQIRLSNVGTRVLVAATWGRGAWMIAPVSNGPDFALQVSPDFAFQAQGQPTQLTATVAAVNGYSSSVNLTCTTPASSCSIQPASVQPGQSATVSITSSALPQGGSVTISASDGTNTHTQSVQLQTSSLRVNPATTELLLGRGSFISTDVEGINLSGPATIACQNLPPGITCDIYPPFQISPTNPLTSIDFNASATAAPGTYTVQVVATEGSQTLSAPVTLNVHSFELQGSPWVAGVTDATGSATFSLSTSTDSNATTPIALSCDQGVQCSFNPATISPNNGNSTLTVSNLGSLAQPLQFNVIGTAGKEVATVPLTVKLETWSVTPQSDFSTIATGTDHAFFLLKYNIGADLPFPQFTCTVTGSVQCQVQPAGQFIEVDLSGLSSLPSDTKSYSFQVQATVGTQQQTIPLSVSFGYIQYSSPLWTQQVVAGTDTTSFILNTAQVQNYTTPINLTCTVPSGVACAASPATINPGQSSTINVSGLAAVKPKDVTVAVTATSGVLHPQLKFTARISDFTLGSPTATPTLASGSDTATFTVHATSVNFMRGPIQLGCSNAAPVKCSFSPANLVGGTSSKLTVSGLSKATVTNSQIPITVTGTSGSTVHNLALAVNVPDFAGTPTPGTGSGSGSGASQTVTAGQTAQYALAYNSVNGFSGTVTMSCTGAPAQATCSVSPASFTLTSGGTQAVKVSVSTTGKSLLLPLGSAPTDRNGSLGLVLVLLGLAGLGLTGLSRRQRLTIAGTMLLAALLLAGCGGGGSSNFTPPPPVVQPTPAGTSTLTVTATANGVSHSTQLTLTVQ